MPKGDNDMPKKIRRPLTINGVNLWISGNNEQEYAENIIRAVLGGAKAPDTSSTPHARSTNFRAYAENFMALYKRGKVWHTTLAGYEGYLKNHIYPFFGKMALEEISVDTVQAFLNAKADLSEHTVDELHRLLNSTSCRRHAKPAYWQRILRKAGLSRTRQRAKRKYGRPIRRKNSRKSKTRCRGCRTFRIVGFWRLRCIHRQDAAKYWAFR